LDIDYLIFPNVIVVCGLFQAAIRKEKIFSKRKKIAFAIDFPYPCSIGFSSPLKFLNFLCFSNNITQLNRLFIWNV
jgi:hypothetical protein